MFRKISEEELRLADELKDALRKTREAFVNNFDQQDAQFVNLYDELKRLFQKGNLDEVTQEEMKKNIGALEKIQEKILELNRKNSLLRAKYESDAKYARVHKRIMERGNVAKRETDIQEALMEIKQGMDEKVMQNDKLMNSDGFFAQMMQQNVVKAFDKITKLNTETARFINSLLVREYMSEYQGT
jgi:type I restriction enzyme R subunit